MKHYKKISDKNYLKQIIKKGGKTKRAISDVSKGIAIVDNLVYLVNERKKLERVKCTTHETPKFGKGTTLINSQLYNGNSKEKNGRDNKTTSCKMG